jgi:hypothetical protein
MADIQLNSVTLATESGGTVSLDNAVQDNITRLGTVTAGTLNSTVVTSGWNKVEFFPHSEDVVGTIANGGYLGRFAFTPTFNSVLLVGWGFSYRHSTTTHCYLVPELLNSSNTVLESLRSHGANYYSGASSWNNGSGGLEYAGTALTGGTTYKLQIKINSGASIDQANDTGDDLAITAICYS